MARDEPPGKTPQPVGDRQMLAPQGPPRLMNQQPVPIELRRRRRTFGDVLTGLAALIALVALVCGVPLALASFIGWPLPHHMPDGNVLNSQITTKTYVDTLAVFVWIAWAQFTACVLVETVAAARGVGMPSRVPLSGGSQMLARQLVAAVLLITASAASFAPGLSSLGRAHDDGTPQRAQVAATALAHGHGVQAGHQGSHQGLATDRATTVDHTQRSGSTMAGNQALPRPDASTNVTGQTKFYRVTPPQGRHHDSLWDIAQRHLGDGRRYQEIYDLNKDKVQPDGSTLTKASLIRPGWILEMPGDATGGDLVANPFNAHGAAAPGLDGMAVRGGSGGGSGMEIPATQAPASPSEQAGAFGGGHGGGLAPGLDGSSAGSGGGSGGGATAPGLAGSGGGAGDAGGSGGIGGTSGTTQAPASGMQLASHASSADGGSLGQVTTSLAAVVRHTQAPPIDTAGPDLVVASQHTVQAATPLPQQGVPLHTPGGIAGAPVHGTAPEAPAAAASSTQAPDSAHTPFRLPYELVAAPLLAAGLLGALGRNRRRQLWNRALGRRLTVPGTAAAAAEEAIRLGAGLGEVRFLNRALRELAAVLTAAERPLPAVYAARLTAEGLELLLSEPAPNAPAPWSAREDARAWFVPRAAVGRMDDETVARTVAPYPGLVTAGVTGAARVLLDLEAAAGVISVGGDDTTRRAVLAAMAVELATNTWSDRMTVTLIGFPGDLTPLAPGRIRQAPSLDDVLPDLKAELDARRAALGQAGAASVLSGRLGAVAGAAWPPHFIISAQTPSPAAAAALADITGGGGDRTGVGYLIAGDVPSAAWQLSVAATGRISAPLLDLDLDAQRLPDDQYAAVLELFGATQDLLGVPMPPLTAEAAVLEAQLRTTPTVSVRLIGDLEVTGAGDLQEDRRALVTEALTFLMLHRDGVHPRVLASALWPRGVSNDISDAVVNRLGHWLGTDPEGAPNLRILPDGRYTIGPSVRSDWEMFRTLRALADQDPRYQDPTNRDQLLGQALGLVRGPLLARRDPTRYAWLAYESVEAEIPAIIADTAVELCNLRLAADAPEAAVDAVRSGMRGSPADEELWRALLRATHATGDAQRLADVIDGIQRQTRTIHGERGLHPKTEALVDELLPTWRTPATVGA